MTVKSCKVKHSWAKKGKLIPKCRPHGKASSASALNRINAVKIIAALVVAMMAGQGLALLM